MNDNLLGGQNAIVKSRRFHSLRRTASIARRKIRKGWLKNSIVKGLSRSFSSRDGPPEHSLYFLQRVQRQILPDDRKGGISPSYLGMPAKYEERPYSDPSGVPS
jgi:hypothetical protein